MPHLLDNMIWQALNSGNKGLAVVEGKAGYYRPDIAPFAGVQEMNTENMDALHALLPPDRKVAISFTEPFFHDSTKWQTLQAMDCCQMVYEVPVHSFSTPESSLILPMGGEHVPQMLELTRLTKPGPFLENTILFGNYFGIFIEGQLAALSGERMQPLPYLEVSAVCTHPDHRGRGYARALMLRVMEGILAMNKIPFLHVLANNTGAIQLYESIGFRVRREIRIDVMKRM